jgi:thiol-disulfide isomerase/thioredoxin
MNRTVQTIFDTLHKDYRESTLCKVAFTILSAILKHMLNFFSSAKTEEPSAESLLNVQPARPATEFVGLGEWVQGQPTSLAELRGQVVLVEFWTFGCINCVRTLPTVERWYQTYKDEGFVVIGIHAPEFDHERVAANVAQAVIDCHLTYPVVLDNNLATWQAYDNRYWPAQYLIDRQGLLRNTHYGEGRYEETEQAIRLLLDNPTK